jgi:hypothetical protein
VNKLDYLAGKLRSTIGFEERKDSTISTQCETANNLLEFELAAANQPALNKSLTVMSNGMQNNLKLKEQKMMKK